VTRPKKNSKRGRPVSPSAIALREALSSSTERQQEVCRLHQQWEKLAYFLARRYYLSYPLGDQEEFDSIAHCALVKAIIHLDPANPQYNQKAFLWTSIANALTHHINQESRRREVAFSVVYGEEMEEDRIDCPSREKDPSSKIEKEDFLAHCRRCCQVEHLEMVLAVADGVPINQTSLGKRLSRYRARNLCRKIMTSLRRAFKGKEQQFLGKCA
jgi:hypothetical protein